MYLSQTQKIIFPLKYFRMQTTRWSKKFNYDFCAISGITDYKSNGSNQW